jgi:hypothetical protein
MIIEILNQLALNIMILLIWFKTDAFLEYMSLFRIKGLTKIKHFEEYKKINPTISYLNFIKIKFPNFFTKLITCPYCLSFWTALGICFLFNNILFLPLYYIGSIFVYKLLENYL